jgi:hypothetical protein
VAVDGPSPYGYGGQELREAEIFLKREAFAKANPGVVPASRRAQVECQRRGFTLSRRVSAAGESHLQRSFDAVPISRGDASGY